MMMLILTPRLKAIANSIKGFDTMADIGSDHAYLPIYLARNGQVKKAIATDVNRGPVEISKDRIRNNEVQEKVEVRHGNGLEPIRQGESEAIVIAGMGGMLIRDILDNGVNVAKSAKMLILQPMRDSDKVRKWLIEKGFDIIDEELVKEQDRIYEILWAEPSGEGKKAEGLMLVGDKIIQKKHPLAAEFVSKKADEMEKVIAAMKDMDTEKCRERREECKMLLNFYREVLRCVQ